MSAGTLPDRDYRLTTATVGSEPDAYCSRQAPRRRLPDEVLGSVPGGTRTTSSGPPDLGRLVLVPPVPGHDTGTAHVDLADPAGLEGGAGPVHDRDLDAPKRGAARHERARAGVALARFDDRPRSLELFPANPRRRDRVARALDRLGDGSLREPVHRAEGLRPAPVRSGLSDERGHRLVVDGLRPRPRP